MSFIDNILYETLGVQRNASSYEIRSAYLKKIDSGENNSQNLELIRAAYKVLMNPDLRLIYDESGLEGLNKICENPNQNGENESTNTQNDDSSVQDEDYSDDIFHVKNDDENENTDKNSKNTEKEVKTLKIELTLEQLFFGCDIPIGFSIEEPCEYCHGTGNSSGTPHPICPKCHGSGYEMVTLYTTPGYNTFQLAGFPRYRKTTAKQICEYCLGRGELESESSICQFCYGRKMQNHNVNFILYVNPGTRPGEVIQVPIKVANKEIIVNTIISQKKHPFFELNGYDLIYNKNITLSQALCGLTISIKCIDGKILIIKSDENCVINPGYCFTVEGGGFIIDKNIGMRGNLYIKFIVQMPNFYDLKPRVVKFIETIQPINDIKIEPGKTIHDKIYYIDLPFENYAQL